jgi:hypothetical protein
VALNKNNSYNCICIRDLVHCGHSSVHWSTLPAVWRQQVHHKTVYQAEQRKKQANFNPVIDLRVSRGVYMVTARLPIKLRKKRNTVFFSLIDSQFAMKYKNRDTNITYPPSRLSNFYLSRNTESCIELRKSRENGVSTCR